ncbi:MAG: 3-phosphoserine/phosphohydroxythreonine transaminase [Pseudomonadales bacterium]|jgi:phosphoserine aminotransferase|nr:3-phosphoserine/phosphohydroxythreonine transaminase [Pseudomonadales bacterium]
MTDPVYNFGAGPAMLPVPVMQQIQREFLDFQGMGVSLIEISHRSKEFDAVIDRCDELVREVGRVPSNYKILYTHGGAQMQFAAVPLNLLGLKPAHKAVYTETGNFSKLANQEAKRYGNIVIASSSKDTKYDRLPPFTRAMVDDDASYAFITSNNTIYGTQYATYPDMGDIPLVVDSTSDIFSRPVDFSRTGVVFAGLQKNLGPSGMAMVLVREDLLGHALERTPSLLDYKVYADSHSMTNTINTFAVYVMKLVLEWLKEQGGVEAIGKRNEEKARTLYQALDEIDLYQAVVQPEFRSRMNVTFTLPTDELTDMFVKEAQKQGLYALKGHRVLGGIRASIYNAMPLAGCQKLAEFMREFARTKG